MLRLLTLLTLVFTLPLSAQLVEDHWKALAPRNIGPAGMSGRVTTIDVHPSDKDKIYVGTASGGLWISNNGGTSFKPVFDDQKHLSIGAVAVSDKNPSILWAGTGEGNPRNSANYGGGIFRSLNGGKDWELMGLEDTRHIHRVIIHPNDPNTVFVGALGSMWAPNPERGVYKTTDGGKTWNKVLYVDEGTGIADMVMDPTNPNKLIAASWTFDRDPDFFNSGGPGSGIWISHDGGANWTRKTAKDGLPKGDLGRIGLAIAASNPDIVYALVEAKVNGLYKSTDGGETFQLVSDKNIGNRPFYYADIYVDPQNENRIFNVYTYVSRSEDGGKTFKEIANYGNAVHPDHHAFYIDPDDPEYIINGNDGGLNISRDGGDTWRFANNLPLAQFYHISYDMSFPYLVGGGMQDNGSWVGPSQGLKSGGITEADWQEVYFGDGFDLMFKPDDSNIVYAASQGGYLGKVNRTTGKTQLLRPVHPDGTFLRYNWNAPIAQSPYDDCTIYIGSQFVHKSTDCGNNWEIISPDLTTNDTTKQRQMESGGLTIDATQAENHTTLLTINPDPFDKNTLYAGSDDGRLHITRDGGDNWTELTDRLPGMTPGSWIGYIEVSPTNAGEAFVVVNDYRRGDTRPLVYHTKDYGQRFTTLVDENKVTGHAQAIVQDPEANNLLFLGTDQGLWFSLDYGDTWERHNTGFPNVSTIDLKIHPREHDLIIGTFGRAAWILDDIRPFRTLASEGMAYLQDTFHLFPIPTAYQYDTRSYQGIRFYAQGEFQGKDRPSGALMTTWVLPEGDLEGPDPVEKPKEKFKIQIVDASGDTIRTFTKKAAWGMNRLSWNLRRDGVRFPSRREVKEDTDLPSGSSVVPGTYTAVVNYGDHSEASTFAVKPDPRDDYSPGQYEQRDALMSEMNATVGQVTTAFDRLQEARKSLARVEGTLAATDDSIADSLKAGIKDLNARIAELEELLMEPADVKGIQRSPTNLQAKMYFARGYISQVEGSPSQMATVALEQFRTQASTFVEKVNGFLEDELTDFRREVDAAGLSLFGDVGPVKR